MFFVTVKVIKMWKTRTPDSILGKPVQTTHYVSELSKKRHFQELPVIYN
jgi:hypothetical protein